MMSNAQFVCLAETYIDTVYRVAFNYLKSAADADKFAIAGLPVIVMKDASSVTMNIRHGGNGETGYQMNAPIVFQEVDYILLPDGTKLPMPE